MSGGGLFEQQEEGLDGEDKHHERLIISNMKDFTRIQQRSNILNRFAKLQSDDNAKDPVKIIEEIYSKYGKDDPATRQKVKERVA